MNKALSLANMSFQMVKHRANVVWTKLDSFPNFRRFAAICFLQFLSTRYYLLSLAGGEVDWVKANLFKLGMYILFSALFFCAAFLISVGLSPPKYRILTIIALLAIAGVEFAIDRGDNFKQHGSYNALVFGALSFIVLSVSLSIMLCHHLARRKDIFWRVFVIVTLATGLFVFLRLNHYRTIWGDGLLHHKMKRDPGMCSFEYRGNWPFVDLLPDGIQNFWTGSQICPAQAFKIEATVDSEGVLTMKCPETQGKPYYTILPDTRPLETSEKIIGKLHESIRTRSTKMDYNGPVKLTPTQEAVIVQCGDAVEEIRFNFKLSERFRDSKDFKRDEGKSRRSSPTLDREDPVRHEFVKLGRGKSDSLSRQPVNVLVLFLDAVSRRHMHRKLPKTMEVLTNLHSPSKDHSGARLWQFFRYHIVGFNTNHNTRALYTGDRNHDPERRTIVEDAFESEPKRMTLRAETNCEDWSSEYSGRATSTAYDHELLTPFCHPSYYSHDGHPFGNFKGPYSILRRCLFDRYVHRHTFDYLEGILSLYRQKAPATPWFVTGSFIEGHEGTGEVLSTLDSDLSKFLLRLASDGTLQNTALFLLSDHGLHMGLNFVYTTNGIIEHANPALFAVIPERVLSDEAMLNLDHNEQALLTGVNIYHTWRDVLDLSHDDKLSLFRTQLPLNADCGTANIGPEFCQCK
jgi:hypothetical protein